MFLEEGQTNWKFIIIVVVLAAITGGGILYCYSNLSEYKVTPIEFLLKTEKKVEDETADWKTYRNEEYGFEVKYPGNIFIKKTTAEQTLPPSYTEKLNGIKLVHAIPIQYCGESGLPEHCRPETEDITIGFFPIEKSFQDTITPIKNLFGNEVKEVIIADEKGISVHIGVEGEGINYYFIPLNQNKTLLISRSYINERLVTVYQGAKDFISFIEQEKIFNQTISTFRFLD